MSAKAWQWVGAGVSVPLMGWALSDILEGNTWIAFVAFPFAIGLGAICLIGIVLATRRANKVRSSLAEFIAECDALILICQTEGEAAPTPQIEAFRDRLEAFVRRHLSEAHIVRMSSPGGSSSRPIGRLSEEQLGHWRWLRNRRERLHEFIREAEASR